MAVEMVTRYLVTLLTRPGCHAPPRCVEVVATGATGPHGHALYGSADGQVLVEITPEGLALTADGAALLPARPLHGHRGGAAAAVPWTPPPHPTVPTTG